MHKAALFATLSSTLVVLALPREADACGGTFCDGGGGPQTMPVDQTGENILFVMDGTTTEAHIQIQYDPNTAAQEFAWIVPMTALPDFTVGCDAFFDNLLASTVPVYGFNTTFDNCGGGSSGFSSTAASSASGGDGGLEESGGAGDSSGGPDVVLQETVGAFDITVLSGGTAAEVMQWLGDNGYNQDPNAEPILAEYLAENYLFAAFKLTNGAEVAEIHPIVLTFQNDEACVPIRLTRIAAQEDMEIRTFFLAESRVVPSTYKHVLVNPLRLNWPGLASNYKEIITLAVDAFEAEGKAFVTEYAATSSVVQTFGIYDPLWDSAPFATMLPIDVIDALGSQGLVYCYGGGDISDGGGGSMCQFNHTLLRGILNQFLPVPVGLDEVEFYGCLSCYEAQIDLMAWDGPLFAAAMQERIIDPGLHAIEALGAFPFLTRMYTTISPAEMTADPFFYQNPDLPEVDLTSQIASQRVLCNGDNLWTLPDGREVYVPGAAAWPSFDQEMPYEEEVQEMPAQGPPIGLVDNSALIEMKLAQYNCQFDWPTPDVCGAQGDGSGTGGSDGDSGSGSAGADGDANGCGCTADPTPASGALFGLALVGVARRRRRR